MVIAEPIQRSRCLTRKLQVRVIRRAPEVAENIQSAAFVPLKGKRCVFAWSNFHLVKRCFHLEFSLVCRGILSNLHVGECTFNLIFKFVRNLMVDGRIVNLKMCLWKCLESGKFFPQSRSD
jgi:hypothetical protein